MVPFPVSVADAAATIGGGAFSVAHPPSATTHTVPANKTVNAFMAVPPASRCIDRPDGGARRCRASGKSRCSVHQTGPRYQGGCRACLAWPGGLVSVTGGNRGDDRVL